MGNICAACHRIKPDNPSRFHRDCWFKFQERERVEHYFTARPASHRKAVDARNGEEGTNIKGEDRKPC